MTSPFDRNVFGAKEIPVPKNLNIAASAQDRTVRDVLQLLLAGRPSSSPVRVSYSGFLADSFQLSVLAGGAVQVSPGIGFMFDPSTSSDLGTPDLAAGVDDLSTYKPLYLSAPVVFPAPAKPAIGFNRIDLIEVRADRRLQDPITLTQEDPTRPSFGYDDFTRMVFPKTLSYSLDGHSGVVTSPAPSTSPVSYKIGAAALAGTETAPATTPGYVPIGVVQVIGGTGFANVVVDQRALLAPGGVVNFSGTWRVQWNAGAPIVTAHSIQAPPGVQIGLRSLAARGQAELWVVGGAPKGGTVTITASHAAGLNTTTQFAVGVQSYDGTTGNQLITMTDTDANRAFGAVPSVNATHGTLALHAGVASRFVSLAGINITDPSLEDMVVRATGCLSYV